MLPVEILTLIAEYCDVKTLLVIYKYITELRDIVSPVLFHCASVLVHFADAFAIELDTEITTRYYTRFGEEVPYGVLNVTFEDVAALLKVVKLDLGTHDTVPKKAWEFVRSIAKNAKSVERIEYYGPKPIYKQSFLFEEIRNVLKEINILVDDATLGDGPCISLREVTKLSIDHGTIMEPETGSITIKEDIKHILANNPDHLQSLTLSNGGLRYWYLDVAELCEMVTPLKSLTSLGLPFSKLLNKSGHTVVLPQKLVHLEFIEDESLLWSPRPIFHQVESLRVGIFKEVWIRNIELPNLAYLELKLAEEGIVSKENIEVLFRQAPNIVCLRLGYQDGWSLAPIIAATGVLKRLRTLDLGAFLPHEPGMPTQLLGKMPSREKITALRIRSPRVFKDCRWPVQCVELFPNLAELYLSHTLGQNSKLFVKVAATNGYCGDSACQLDLVRIRQGEPLGRGVGYQ